MFADKALTEMKSFIRTGLSISFLMLNQPYTFSVADCFESSMDVELGQNVFYVIRHGGFTDIKLARYPFRAVAFTE